MANYQPVMGDFNASGSLNKLLGPGGKVAFDPFGGAKLLPLTRCFAATYSVVDNSVSANTYVQVLNIPAQFDAIRIGFAHMGGGGAVAGLKALIASTDDLGDRSLTNTTSGRKIVSPWFGGSEQNTVSTNGWQSVTWGGATSVNIADPGANVLDTAWSDVIECHGIEDSANPGWYPLIVRVFPGTAFFSRCSYVGASDPTKMIAETGAAFVAGANKGGSDSVTTPANWNNGGTTSFSDSSVLPLIIEAYAGTRRTSVMTVGDSRFASCAPSNTTRTYRAFSWFLEQALISYKAPVVRCCMGGLTSAQYYQRGTEYLDNMAPAVSVYLVLSSNDGSPTASVVASARTRALQHIAQCRAKGAQPVLVTSFPVSGGLGANYANAAALDAWVAATGLSYFSPLATYGTNTGDWQGGLNDDPNHMTDAGYADFAARIRDLVIPFLA